MALSLVLWVRLHHLDIEVHRTSTPKPKVKVLATTRANPRESNVRAGHVEAGRMKSEGRQRMGGKGNKERAGRAAIRGKGKEEGRCVEGTCRRAVDSLVGCVKGREGRKGKRKKRTPSHTSLMKKIAQADPSMVVEGDRSTESIRRLIGSIGKSVGAGREE